MFGSLWQSGFLISTKRFWQRFLLTLAVCANSFEVTSQYARHSNRCVGWSSLSFCLLPFNRLKHRYSCFVFWFDVFYLCKKIWFFYNSEDYSFSVFWFLVLSLSFLLRGRIKFILCFLMGVLVWSVLFFWVQNIKCKINFIVLLPNIYRSICEWALFIWFAN
jgi:hypothetical protein